MKIQYSKSRNFEPEVVEIYNYSFPDNEKKPIQEISLNLASGKEELIIAKIDSEIVGFALIFSLDNSEWSLLDYLAVSESKRGLGVGKSLLRFIKKDLKKKSRSLVIEVDKPLGANQAYDFKCLNRINFYKQCGATLINEFEYILPSLNNSNKTKQYLMVIPFDPNKGLSVIELKKLIKDIYQQNYTEYYLKTDLDLMCESIKNNYI